MNRLEFWELDPARRLLIDPKRGGKIIGLSRGAWFTGRDESGDVEYILQRIPAGTYFLAYANWRDHGHNAIDRASIAIEVKPGEVTYVGDYGFTTPWTILGTIAMTQLSRNPAAARGLLARYPHLNQGMRDQQPQVLSAACDLGTYPNQACFAPS